MYLLYLYIYNCNRTHLFIVNRWVYTLMDVCVSCLRNASVQSTANRVGWFGGKSGGWRVPFHGEVDPNFEVSLGHGGFHRGTPIAGWLMENHIKMHGLGLPHDYGNRHKKEKLWIRLFSPLEDLDEVQREFFGIVLECESQSTLELLGKLFGG
jgi:hypothetical protein